MARQKLHSANAIPRSTVRKVSSVHKFLLLIFVVAVALHYSYFDANLGLLPGDVSSSSERQHAFKSNLVFRSSTQGKFPPPPSIITASTLAIDWTDSIFKREGWDNDPVVIESHKLVFFTIPKNSCTEFKMLFRRMMGFPDWKTVGSKDEKLHDPGRNGLKYMGSFPKERQAEFMTSPEWTRAIFLRDPKERVLSAYMDKGLNGYKEYNFVKGGYIKNHCCQINQWSSSNEVGKDRLKRSKPYCLPLFPFEKDATPQNFPFDHFVKHFLGTCFDIHWARQSKRMKDASWRAINFVGHLDTLKDDAHALLRRTEAYEKFGKEGWGPQNGPIFDQNLNKHTTSAKEKANQFYGGNHNIEVEKLVMEYYRSDYEHPHMNITKPDRWDALMGKKRREAL